LIKPVRIKYLVSSHVGYYDKTLPLMLPPLIGQVGAKNVVVTIAGGGQGRQMMGVKTDWVAYNSFEYSSLINFVESNNDQCDFVFLLHDTMNCGENFSRLSARPDVFSDVTMAHEKGWCNLGAFKVQFLLSIKDSLIAMKNISKEKAIRIEGKFFGEYATYENPYAEILSDFCESPYGGVERCACRFNSVDVIKYGSNDSTRFRSGIFNSRL
jgi:hypothetical protein